MAVAAIRAHLDFGFQLCVFDDVSSRDVRTYNPAEASAATEETHREPAIDVNGREAN